MHECSYGDSYGDSYYWYIFEHNPFIFSTEPIWSGKTMHKGNLTREELKKLIFDE
jgi:hypothetical protein